MAVKSPVAALRVLAEVSGGPRYLDEHAGSLEGAARRLTLAEDNGTPLPERLRALAGAARFVDEFFQLTGAHDDGVRDGVEHLLGRQGDALRRLRGRFAEIGVELCDWDGLADGERQAVTATFCDRILPALAPVIPGPGKSSPPSANLSLNIAVLLSGGAGRGRRVAVTELPPGVPRFLPIGTGRRGAGTVVPVEQVVAANLAELFPTDGIEAWTVFRVTRQAGVAAAPGVEDVLATVERQLRLERHHPAVRLEVGAPVRDEMVERLMADLDLDRTQVYAVDGMLALTDLADLAGHAVPGGAGRPPAARRRPPPRATGDIFRSLDQRDVLVHFPYDSYTESVVALLDQASADPALLGIKQTLYRPSPEGPTMRALIRAAERGAPVVAVVELAARLDERASVTCARALERAGAHVVYGLVGLRTHCPLTLVIRDGGDRVSRYGVVGTGLHHPVRRPEGLSLLTADADVTADLAELFNYLTGYSRPARFRKLLVAPGHLRDKLLDLIRAETAAGPAGRIVLKLYRLVDREVIDALYRASQRGVRVDLVVSGACALRPGLPGLSQGVRVVATLGRHFETSRLFAFGSDDSGPVFLSSGDLGLAHVYRQVDVAAPVDDRALRGRLRTTLDTLLRFPAWEMDGDGVWHPGAPGAEDALRDLAASTANRRRPGS